MTLITPTLPMPRTPLRLAPMRGPDTTPGAPPDLTKPQASGWEPGAFKPRSEGQDRDAGASRNETMQADNPDTDGSETARDAVGVPADIRAERLSRDDASGQTGGQSDSQASGQAALRFGGVVAAASDTVGADKAAALRDEARNGYLYARLVSMAAPDPVTMARAA